MNEGKHKFAGLDFNPFDSSALVAENIYGPAKEDGEKALLFKVVFDAAPNGLIVVDQQGRILLSNPCASKIFGYSCEEFNTLKVEDLIPKRFKSVHINNRANFHKAPEARKMGVGRDLSAVRKDGTEFPLEVGLNPIRLNGQIMVLCSIIDITERKKNEQNLEQFAEKLQDVNSELSEYTHVVSHDLRGPLRAIRNYADFIKEDIQDQLEPTQMEYLDGLLRAVKQADKMATDLLELSRVGKQIEKPEEVDIHSLLSSIIDEFKDHEDVVMKIEEKWPRLKSDPILLRQIFDNLISNSIKFNTSSLKEIEISWNDLDDKFLERRRVAAM